MPCCCFSGRQVPSGHGANDPLDGKLCGTAAEVAATSASTEVSLVNGATVRAATVTARFRQDMTVADHPGVLQEVRAEANFLNNELQIVQHPKSPAHAAVVRSALRQTRAFACLPAALIEIAVGACEDVGELSEGSVLVHERQPDDRCFVVLQGSFSSSSSAVGCASLSTLDAGMVACEAAVATSDVAAARLCPFTLTCVSPIGRAYALRSDVHRELVHARLRCEPTPSKPALTSHVQMCDAARARPLT